MNTESSHRMNCTLEPDLSRTLAHAPSSFTASLVQLERAPRFSFGGNCGMLAHFIKLQLCLQSFRALRGPTSGPRVHCACCAACLLYTSPSPRDRTRSRMPSSA
eukprot:TRINITY_DN6536_c0_g1_i3.p1 TRINITY_DN6536_c0_g1~~TRINITY_DN6536_c0_g1_i3.p1  ORF type:complete len:104 (-),score=9.98 TRINITY_DN6536_c0_g1_i3:18-329(-)